MTPSDFGQLTETDVRIDRSGPLLEGRLHAGSGKLAAVVLHPHPQYGGDMHNHVVVAICEALAAAGASTLRFNFRGTGASEGTYDGGRGEVDDAVAAVATSRAAHPDARVILIGYSFGAIVAANAAMREPELAALALVSPPLAMAPLPQFRAGLPVLLVTGELDQIAPAAALTEHAETCAVRLVAGADHGWWPGIDELTGHLTAFIQGLEAGGD